MTTTSRAARWWLLFLALLGASHVVQIVSGSLWTPTPASLERRFADEPTWIGASSALVPSCCDDGPLGDARIRLAWLEWAGEGAEDRPPIILLHGSPGQAYDWTRLAPAIASEGYRVLAIDRPGFGNGSPWLACYSARANARMLLALMDELDVERAHLVGWSHSGLVILNMADIDPSRLASLTMLGATGDQRVEGSGSYHFEHAKYAVGYALVVLLPELIPHFGVLDRQMRHAFIRDFWDSDQRPMTRIMRSIQTPTLVLHGRHDPLVPARAAELHHALIPASRLVMLDAGHLFPFYEPTVGSAWLVDHVRRHDTPGTPPLTGEVILATERPPAFGAVGRAVVDGARWSPWYLTVLVIALAVLLRADLAAVVCAGLVATVDLDFGVALTGLVLGGVLEAGLAALLAGSDRRLVRRWLGDVHPADWARRCDRRPVLAPLVSRFLPERRRPAAASLRAGVRRPRVILGLLCGIILWSLLALVVAQLGMVLVAFPLRDLAGTAGLVAGALACVALIRAGARLVTWTGRRQLRASLTRITRYEFWPPQVFYAPLVPWLLLLSIRHRGLLAFTCVNPGIPNGGGTIGERKSDILPGFDQDDPRLLHWRVIAPGPPDRRASELEAIAREPSFGFPLIVKPDASQRGFGVKLVRSPEEALDYFQSMTRPAIAQAYHPGPHECGVLWARRPGEAHGRIFSITLKRFQEVVGDDRHTLEELIYRDPRLRAQARVFLRRFGADASRIPAKGERVRLSIAGNHAQGAKFLDGEPLRTPGLEQAVDRICTAYRGIDEGELDYGRFDLRYESEDALARGEFAIVELNGAMSESTNIYDPSWTVARAYATLFRQWALVYELGAWRRAQGRRPMSIRDLVTTAIAHFGARRGPSVSD